MPPPHIISFLLQEQKAYLEIPVPSFIDTNGVISSFKLKDRQYNGKKKKKQCSQKNLVN